MLHWLRTVRRVRAHLVLLEACTPLSHGCAVLSPPSPTVWSEHPWSAGPLQARHMGRYTRRPGQEQRERERLQELNSAERTPCNAGIRAQEVRLIHDGKHDVVPLADAIREARKLGLDLVQVGVTHT